VSACERRHHFLSFIAMDDDDNDNLLILTGGELLDVGLDLIGYTDAMVLRASEDSNEERFQRLYGSSAFACAQLWEAELRASRPEYLEFSAKVFRGHVHQEVKTQKFYAQQK
jgi:hypothetical protein